MKKYIVANLTLVILLLLTACGTKSICPEQSDSSGYPTPPDTQSQSVPSLEDSLLPTEVKVGGRLRTVDRIISGPLCDDHWKGTVYVTCDVQVSEWEEDPLFLKGCNLLIEPNTVVYVADHNDAAYYNGCSCHTGEQP